MQPDIRAVLVARLEVDNMCHHGVCSWHLDPLRRVDLVDQSELCMTRTAKLAFTSVVKVPFHQRGRLMWHAYTKSSCQ